MIDEGENKDNDNNNNGMVKMMVDRITSFSLNHPPPLPPVLYIFICPSLYL